MNWKDYEIEIHNYFQRQFPHAQISHNVTLVGRYSKVERQIDILVEDYIAGSRIRIVVDGKFFSQKIDVKDVEMFIGMLNDCEANKGLLITQEGFSKAAINRAHFDPIDIELDILNFKDLYDFQGFGGVIHVDNHGVVIPAPFGWIIDATYRNEMLASLYQRGLTFEEAVNSYEWMYVNIWGKEGEIKTLDDFLEHQASYTKKDFPTAEIKYLQTIRRDNFEIRLREIAIETYPTKEYTGFVDFDNFIFFCVMFSPVELRKKNIRKLESILQQSIPLNVIHTPSQNSH